MTPPLRNFAEYAILIGFMRKKHPLLTARTLQSIGLGLLFSIGAFSIGIETAGDVHPFGKSEAAIQDFVRGDGAPIHGDVNGNGILDVEDVIIILENAEELEAATQEEIRRGDTDGDLRLTVTDALRILHRLSLR